MLVEPGRSVESRAAPQQNFISLVGSSSSLQNDTLSSLQHDTFSLTHSPCGCQGSADIQYAEHHGTLKIAQFPKKAQTSSQHLANPGPTSRSRSQPSLHCKGKNLRSLLALLRAVFVEQECLSEQSSFEIQDACDTWGCELRRTSIALHGIE